MTRKKLKIACIAILAMVGLSLVVRRVSAWRSDEAASDSEADDDENRGDSGWGSVA